MKRLAFFAMLLCGGSTACLGQQIPSAQDLVEAARQGDVDRVQQHLAAGVDVNARGRFGITAIWQAASKGHEELLRLLLDEGADVNVPDEVWHAAPLTLVDEPANVALLLEHGANGGEEKLYEAALAGNAKLVEAILQAQEFTPSKLALAKAHAEIGEHAEVVALLDERYPDSLPDLVTVPESVLETYVGQYVSERMTGVGVSIQDGRLVIDREAGSEQTLIAVGTTNFVRGGTRYRFEASDGKVAALVVEGSYSSSRLLPKSPDQVAAGPDGSRTPLPTRDAPRILAQSRWPFFRGLEARGLAVNQDLPDEWNVEEGRNIRWRTPIDGLANSCPVVWDDHVFVTTAVSEAGKDDLRIGLYGAIEAVDDDSQHAWRLLCIDAQSGDVMWERTAHEGVPPVDRHTKSTQANSTPATDGEHVVALFNFGGLYCYDFEGKLLWSRDLGVLDSGAFHDRDYQWGFGSSPIIYRGMVLLQCDLQEGSFIAAYDVVTGEEIWQEPRDEVPSWGTPTIFESPDGPLLLTNGTNFARAYDAISGREIWRLGGNAAITVPTPQTAYGLAFITSGYRPIQPIFAVWPGASGDISLATGEQSNAGIAWSNDRGGPYLPTPLVYGGYLYTCGNNGVMACYDAKTGERAGQRRVAKGAASSFTASPVAADGRIYLVAESGKVLVLEAGPELELIAENSLGETCLATPAIAGGALIVRTYKHVVSIGKEQP